jgi:AcrR family transcriptional regulator
MKRASSRSKEATHDRIFGAAARAIRRSGYNGTGVADIMKDAGLTHGGFYAHFPSREAMLAEAADRAGSESVAMMERIAAASPPQRALQAMMQAYLEGARRRIEAAARLLRWAGDAAAGARGRRRHAPHQGDDRPRRPPVARLEAEDAARARGSRSRRWSRALVLARAVDDPRLSDTAQSSA